MNADINNLVQTAKNDGLAILRSAKAALEAAVTSAGKDAEGLVRVAEDDAVKVALDFVPGPFRAVVAPLLQTAASATEANVNKQVDATVSKYVGVAIARIEAILK